MAAVEQDGPEWEVFHGFEDSVLLRDRLDLILQDDSVSKLEFQNCSWTMDFRDAVEALLEKRPFEEVKIVDRRLAGRQDSENFFPQRFGLTRKVFLCSIHVQPTYRFLPSQSDTNTPWPMDEIRLESISIPVELTVSLAEIMSQGKIQEFKFFDCRILDHEAMSRALQSNKSLKRLSFFEGNLEDIPLRCILQSLIGHPSLEKLDIDSNKCRSGGVVALAALIRSTSTLRHLDMVSQAFGAGREIDVSPILTALHDNVFLKELKLGGNNIQDETMDEISTLLQTNRTIERLDLSQNHFTNEGIKILARHLGAMRSLKILDLGANRFDQKGLKLLVDALAQHNHVIERIEVSYDLAKTLVGKELAYYLDLNWGGRKLLLQQGKQGHRRVPLSLWPLVLERANKRADDDQFGEEDWLQRKHEASDILKYFVQHGRFLSK